MSKNVNEQFTNLCLTKDLLDYTEFIKKNRMPKIHIVRDELISLIKEAVAETSPDYEVILFGSHATGLCLHWSDIDLVIASKKPQLTTNNYFLHNLYPIIQVRNQ